MQVTQRHSTPGFPDVSRSAAHSPVARRSCHSSSSKTGTELRRSVTLWAVQVTLIDMPCSTLSGPSNNQVSSVASSLCRGGWPVRALHAKATATWALHLLHSVKRAETLLVSLARPSGESFVSSSAHRAVEMAIGTSVRHVAFVVNSQHSSGRPRARCFGSR